MHNNPSEILHAARTGFEVEREMQSNLKHHARAAVKQMTGPKSFLQTDAQEAARSTTAQTKFSRAYDQPELHLNCNCHVLF